MKTHTVVAVSAVAVLAAFASLLSAAAVAAPKPGESVSIAACVKPGVEGNCLMISAADGTVYNITSANPKPPRDVIIELNGTATDKASACNQGIVLDNIRWTATQRKCPN